MFLENRADKIVRGIFIGGIVYFIGFILICLARTSGASSEIGQYIAIGIFYLGTICKPVGIIVIFKFLCDSLYKILKAIDNYNNQQS
ncbi:MAG: hypothetical protein E6860_09455 [Clostridium sp.]|uniref:hypothetical protein n=1 Tax=Clostridium TaxID=1485 RepID=UPI0006C1E4C8|nr:MULTISPECIES: hypothetical protein [Clostridium]MDU1585752.1 hypothetical protein [Clostridium sp.]MDU1976933.1 hypothetical protein [Clostridium sp.]MDU1992500.1 hypothetical protein [Clostridium sp.]MDU4318466.1 hypothetical protein [Clostridium sp.]CUO14472.1 Uncharacterised protein [Clostridium paraputrificum]